MIRYERRITKTGHDDSQHVQHIRGWFHNNKRQLSSNTGSVLKVKTKPRMLHAWQAYHAITYEKQWKGEVDKVWAQYKAQWVSEHTDTKKPEKTRFQIMCEFMKEKYEEQTEEMKERCEEYRKLSVKGETPVPVDSIQTRNLQFEA